MVWVVCCVNTDTKDQEAEGKSNELKLRKLGYFVRFRLLQPLIKRRSKLQKEATPLFSPQVNEKMVALCTVGHSPVFRAGAHPPHPG